MTVTSLRVIPEPKEGSRTVFDAKVAPVVRGQGTTSYRCGRCGLMLVERITHGQIRNIVIKCPKCGSFNEVP